MTVRNVITLPAARLADCVADWLAKQVRSTPEGVPSLAHLLVVVPTAQSGRILRLKLAKRFSSGLVPPQLRLPAQLVEPPSGIVLAVRTDEIIAFYEALGPAATVDQAAQLSDIRQILGANALTFADVAERIGSLLTDDLADVEIARWQKLADLENSYYAALARRGRHDRIRTLQSSLTDLPAPIGIERIVVACVLDPIPVLNRALEVIALPVTELVPEETSPYLTSSQIVACGTAASEADHIAAIFATVRENEALPALCVADVRMFPDLCTALHAKGVTVHDPSRTPLATSSLGRLVAQLVELSRTRSYSVFSSFLRTGDARRWIAGALGLSDADIAQTFVDLDNRQAELLPETVDDIGPKTHGKLRAVFEFVDVQLRKRGLREILAAMFRDRILKASDPDAREFAAAAGAVNRLLDECFDESVPKSLQRELFARALQEASFSLEPDSGSCVVADGWLEIPFLDAREIIIAGFQEGVVPQAVVGHPFLPDALRAKLGLPDNVARTRRDRRILALALAGRSATDVKVFFHSVDAAGDVQKPSRLLFETSDDRELSERVTALYGVRAGTAEGSVRDLPATWRLKLPVPPAHVVLTKLSPTRLDRYLRCPFTYYISGKDVLGDKRMDDRAEELASWEFGNLAHAALEVWGGTELRDSTDADVIAAFLAEQVDDQLAERFGTSVPAIVAMQGESVKRRLAHFSVIQASRRAAGWRIVAAERKLAVTYDKTLFSGKCDRIDRNEKTGEWCVIDYKTWDSAEKATSFDSKKGWLSLQLPLYCAMLDVLNEGDFSAAKLVNISACYCVLGKTADEVRFTEPLRGTLVPEAEKKVRELIARIERGVFWPPSPSREWQWDYKDWLQPMPEETVDADWIADQEHRLASLTEGTLV